MNIFALPLLATWATKAATVVAVILFAHLGIRFLNLVIEGAFRLGERPGRYLDPGRAGTLRGLLKSVARYVVDFLAVLTVLNAVGVPTQNFLAAAGILGLAVGFGAQSLVKDVITGFFVLYEDQFSVGDYIETGGASGIVEEMGFRVTKIRDFNGALHMVPNGALDQVSNYSRGPMRVLLDISISYEDDVDRAMEVLREVASRYAAVEEALTQGPEVLGVSELGASGVSIQVLARTRPMEQWRVARELRKRIKQALDEAGIEIPYPHRVLVPAEAAKAEKFLARRGDPPADRGTDEEG